MGLARIELPAPSPREDRQRLAWIDLMRTAAVLLVIAEHAVILPGSSLPGYLSWLGTFFLPFRMPALMLLSGMMLPRSLIKGRATHLDGKIRRIAWPFLVWSLVLIVTLRLLGLDENASLKQFLHPTGPLFFLQYLFIFYVTVMAMPPRLRTALIVPALAASFVIDFYEADRFLFLLAFFLTGDVLARHPGTTEAVTSKRSVVLVCSLVGLGAGLLSSTGTDVRYNAAFSLPTAAGILTGIAACRYLAKTDAACNLTRYGRHTIVLYVASWPAQVATWWFIQRMGVSQPLAVVAILLAAGLAAGFGLIELKKRLGPVTYLFEAPLFERRSKVIRA